MHAAPISVAKGSLAELATTRARTLCEVLGLEHRSAELENLCFSMMHPWGVAERSKRPEWPSQVVDDGTPFEFSVAFGARPELRFMVEPLGSAPSLASHAEAALDLLARLERGHAVDLRRLSRVLDLFLPDRPQGAFSIWLAVVFTGDEAPSFKLYLNPQAQGIREAPRVIEEAMARLGFADSWPAIGNVLTRRGPVLDELKYFSLDLSSSKTARVKVYARHHSSTRDVVASAAAIHPAAEPERVHAMLKALAPGVELFDGRGPFTCYAFVEGVGDTPAAVTTHFPVNGYADSDAQIRDRVVAAQAILGVESAAYLRSLAAVAVRPLSSGVGMQSYSSVRWVDGPPRMTVYLPCEAYVPGTVEKVRDARRTSGTRERASEFASLDVRRHPFFRRLAGTHDPTTALCVLVANLRVALEPAVERLRNAAADVPERKIADLLLGLADGLAGSSDFVLAHDAWLLSAACALATQDFAEPGPEMLEPGVRFAERAASVHASCAPYERIGGAMATTVLGSEACAAIGRLLRETKGLSLTASDRLPTLPQPRVSPWTLAEAVSPEDHLAVQSGIERISTAAWLLFNDLYDVCFRGTSA